MELEVRMFGPVAVEVGGRCLGPRDFGGRRQKQTLEILLVHQGEAVPKDRMADLLWGERLPKDPFRTLESYVSTLRSHLAPEAERARRLVVTEANAYRFPLRGADVDLWRFDALVADAGAAPPGKRHDLLTEAADLARGDVMADEPYAEWVLALRDLYRERYVQVVVDAAEDLLTAGDPRRSLVHAADALRRDPTRERAHRVVMAAHALLGEQALALRAYDDCRAALETELGAVPSTQTEQLYVQLVNGEAPAPHERAATTIQLGRSPHPVTRYARSGDDHVAFQVVGDGPVDVVYAPGSFSHIEAQWEQPDFAGFLRRLAAGRRLLLFDKRGVGMSDPAPLGATLDDRADDIVAVMDAVGSERAVVFGASEGGPMGISLAARRPDRVAGLVLFGPFGSFAQRPDYPWGWPPEMIEAFKAALDLVWATGRGVGLANPSVSEDDEVFAEWVARYFRLAVSPARARSILDMAFAGDVRHQLPHVTAPTLVLQRSGSVWVSPDNGRYVAEHIPGARYVELPGADEWPWLGDTESVLGPTEAFLDDLSG